MLQLFQTKKGSFFFIVTLVYSGYIAFPYIMHCIHLPHFFGASSENICHIYSIVHSSSQSVSHLNSVFSFKIHCLQMVQLFQTQKGSFFFIVTLVYSGYIAFPYIMHCIHLSHLFGASSENILSHIFYCAQLVSVCFTLKLCFLL